MSAKMIYGMYKGDKFIDVGTIAELSQRQGIPRRTLTKYAWQSKLKAQNENTKSRCIMLSPVCKECDLMKEGVDYE